jgi:hypothetical protein
VVDFILDGVDSSKFDECGWGVRIEHYSITLDAAIDRIADDAILQIKAEN